MEQNRIVVLKFGSSVLTGTESYPAVVRDIDRHVRSGEKVVAIVSAMEGQTDALLGKARGLNPDPDPWRLAALLGMGEQQSALLLSMALEEAGIAAGLAMPVDVALLSDGAALDADPQSLDCRTLRAMLRKHPVVVMPGFISIDAVGRTALLGRGGSDLTALFIAQQLENAPCRLIKDVDGIYESDPAVAARKPRRFTGITWDQALQVAGKLVQPKAIQFAREHRLTFDVAAIGAPAGTNVGVSCSSFA